MRFELENEMIPGTRLRCSDVGNVTGLAFLEKIFFISQGVMLTQIREISGIDGSTLQNWTKRGWVANSRSKKYDIDQVAHILIINMLRNCMHLDQIAFLIQYINGDVADASDDIVKDSVLYDYICRIIHRLVAEDSHELTQFKEIIYDVIADYNEIVPGTKDRLANALEVIVVTYYAALLKKHSETLIEGLK